MTHHIITTVLDYIDANPDSWQEHFEELRDELLSLPPECDAELRALAAQDGDAQDLWEFAVADRANRTHDTPAYSAFEKQLNLIEGAPGWVRSDTGVVEKPTGPLPADSGIYLMGADARVTEATSDPVVAQVDSASGAILAVYHKHNGRWTDVTEGAVDIQLHQNIGETETKRRFGRRRRRPLP